MFWYRDEDIEGVGDNEIGGDKDYINMSDGKVEYMKWVEVEIFVEWWIGEGCYNGKNWGWDVLKNRFLDDRDLLVIVMSDCVV